MLDFVVGMTTAPRKENGVEHVYLTESLYSMGRAGLQARSIRFGVDPGAEPPASYPQFMAALAGLHQLFPHKLGRTIVRNPEQLGVFENWRTTLRGCLADAEQTGAGWILMVQDDACWTRYAARLLDTLTMIVNRRELGAISLYTAPMMVPHRDAAEPAPSVLTSPYSRLLLRPAALDRHSFWGAVALLFPTTAAAALLEDPVFQAHTHQARLDVVIGRAIVESMQHKLYVTLPSIVDHLGEISSIGRHKVVRAKNLRRGFRFAEPA